MKENVKSDFTCLKKMSFKKQFFGGVNEKDVWEKIKVLQEEHEIQLKQEKMKSLVEFEAQEKIIRKVCAENALLEKELLLLKEE